MNEKTRFSDYLSANDTTSQSLIDAMRNGEADAWEKIAVVWGTALMRYFRGRELQVADAEEITQNVLAKMYGAMSRGKFERDGQTKKLKHFVYHIAENELRTFYKRFLNKPRSPGGSVHLEHLANLGSSEDSVSFEAILVSQILEFIKNDFEESTWQAFCLRYHDSFAYSEIGKQLKIADNAARQKVHRVRERLRQELDAAIENQGD